MTAAASRTSARERILDVAAEIVSEHGVHDLTIDGVAAAVGVTKGGVIYHFKTKDDLLGALVERLISQLEQRNRVKAAKRGNAADALLVALIDDTFDMPRGEKKLLASLLAAASSYPHLIEPAQQLFKRIYEEVAGSGANAGLALGIAAALDGITLLELLNLHQFDKQQRESMRQALHGLVRSLA